MKKTIKKYDSIFKFCFVVSFNNIFLVKDRVKKATVMEAPLRRKTPKHARVIAQAHRTLDQCEILTPIQTISIRTATREGGTGEVPRFVGSPPVFQTV